MRNPRSFPTSMALLAASAVLLPASLACAAGGRDIYETNCKSCHETGLDGAPRLSDKAAWQERLSKGEAALTRAAIEGVEGYGGRMPPRGGNPQLSDADIAAAVQFMVKQALGN